MEYYERFRSLREDNDLTQTEIAEYLGIKQTYYSKQERGQKPFQVNQIQLLCKYYKVSADYILGLAPGLSWPRGKGEKEHTRNRTKYTFLYNTLTTTCKTLHITEIKMPHMGHFVLVLFGGLPKIVIETR